MEWRLGQRNVYLIWDRVVNIRRGGQCEGVKHSSEGLLEHDQQMGGQGERERQTAGGIKQRYCVCVSVFACWGDAELRHGNWAAF